MLTLTPAQMEGIGQVEMGHNLGLSVGPAILGYVDIHWNYLPLASS